MVTQDNNQEELGHLLSLLPAHINTEIEKYNPLHLIEIVMDLGRRPELRFRGAPPIKLTTPVIQQEIDHIAEAIGGFSSENRGGIERTLHRISAIRNQKGKVIGLTCRVGRALSGTIDLETEFLSENKSLLILGPPGSGKTSKLREIAYLYSETMSKRVVIIDTSLEIAGAGDIPHSSIGRARRMPVIDPENQHRVMIEAVENHTPEVIIVDEISTEEEAQAAQTIAERGVILIATAHGRDLESIVKNPSLCRLVGNPSTVTLSDEEAKKRKSQKNILERSTPSVFQTIVEIITFQSIITHTNVNLSVDQLLQGTPLTQTVTKHKPSENLYQPESKLYIYPYAISHSELLQVITSLDYNATIVDSPEKANILICLEDYAQPNQSIAKYALESQTPLFTIEDNTHTQIKMALEQSIEKIVYQNIPYSEDLEYKIAISEVEKSISLYRLNHNEEPINLLPRKSKIRNAQAEILSRHSIPFEILGEGLDKYISIPQGLKKIT